MTNANTSTGPIGGLDLDLSTEPLSIQYWPHDQITPAADNLRGTLTDLADLADSIAERGLLSPIVVTFTGDDGPMIVAGHRRHAAIGRLIEEHRWHPHQLVPCIVNADIDEATVEDRVVAMLIENLQRVDLDPIEEANGYARLRDVGWSNTRIGKATGRNPERVGARLKLLTLPEFFRTVLSAGELTLDMAGRLAAIPAEVADSLAETSTIPDEYAFNLAVREHRVAEAKKLFNQTVKTRGLHIWKDGVWNLRNQSEKVAELDVDAFAAALLPDAPVLYAVLDVYGKTPIVTVWRPHTDDLINHDGHTNTPTPRPVSGELSDYDRQVIDWRAECDRLRGEQQAARKEWVAQRDRLLGEFVTTVPVKEVAAAALWFAVDFDVEQSIGLAVDHAGYTGLTENDDHRRRIQTFVEWLKVPANLSATAAAVIATAGWSDLQVTPLDSKFNELVNDRIGPEPSPASLPEPPTRPDANPDGGLDDDGSDGDDDEPDENAHLDDED